MSVIKYRLPDGRIKEILGISGITPHIGENGNWFIGDIDTGQMSRGEQGETGKSGVYIGSEEPTDPDVSVWINPDGVIESYTLTNTDKRDIADIIISDFDNQLLAILGGDN